MLKITAYFVAILVSAYGAGEVLFLHSPNTIKFEGSEPLDQNLLDEVFSASLGFTIKKGSNWGGLSVVNPFHYAEAVVGVVVDGVASLETTEGHRYPLNTNEDEMTTWLSLSRRVKERFPDQTNTLMRIDLAEDEELLKSYQNEVDDFHIKPVLQYLDTNETEDAQFVKELSLLRQIINKIKSGSVKRDGIPDVYWFVVRGLHPVLDLHGQSEASQEARQLLSQAILDLSDALIQVYNGQVVVAAITSDVSHTRRTRSLKADDGEDAMPNLNLASDYSSDYPIIFNIMLWFGIAFTFIIIAVAVFIGNMDPGRDSIIYRMTSNRMKKDN